MDRKASLQKQQLVKQQELVQIERQIREALAFGLFGGCIDNPSLPDGRFEYRGFFIPTATNNTSG